MVRTAGATCSRVGADGAVALAARWPNISGDAPTVTGERADPSVGCDAGPRLPPVVPGRGALQFVEDPEADHLAGIQGASHDGHGDEPGWRSFAGEDCMRELPERPPGRKVRTVNPQTMWMSFDDSVGHRHPP